MRKNLIKRGYSINLGELIEMGGSPINWVLPKSIRDEIDGKTMTVRFTSYPIVKRGLAYDVKFKKLFYNPCYITELVWPIALKYQELFDNMGENDFAVMNLDEIYITGLFVDTDNLTVEIKISI